MDKFEGDEKSKNTNLELVVRLHVLVAGVIDLKTKHQRAIEETFKDPKSLSQSNRTWEVLPCRGCDKAASRGEGDGR